MALRRLFKTGIFMAGFLSFFVLTAAAEDGPVLSTEKVLIAQGSPVSVKPLLPPAAADAVEDVPGFRGLTKLISFKLTKIEQGHFEPHAGNEAIAAQLKNLFKRKLGMNRTYDLHSRPEELAKLDFKVAAQDPPALLKIGPEDYGKSVYRLYLKRYRQEETTFILYQSEKIS